MQKTIFRTQIFIRLLLIIAIGFSIMYVLTETHFWLVSMWLGLLLLILFFELIRFIERTHLEMENLVIAIRQGDFSNTYYKHPALKGHMLSHAFNQLVSTFQQLRQEKESNHHYFQNIVEQVSVALICVDQQGKVQLVNLAAKQLLKRPVLRHLEDVQAIDSELYHTIKNIQAGEKALIRVIIQQQLLHILLQATEFKMQGKEFKLLSIQDFRAELEEQEVASWQKLIRVLTHEIMNSVIPISNLTGMVSEMLIHIDEDNGLKLNVLNDSEVIDLHGSLLTIEERTNGLINFVKAYKSLTQVAQPQFRSVKVGMLIERLHALLKPKLHEKNITWNKKVEPANLEIKADFELIEQVLINLVNNAIYALQKVKNPEIDVYAFVNEKNQKIIQVIDNGIGIERELVEQIFIPFFTTKKNGSGIGLSLSRQIMRLHKGNISVQSIIGGGTVFTLSF
ncbi:two-component system nitrogen regulation sensor histidine kinase NtrY [Catalinimonas alkaloidigena]|uniref:sensor histidine kinase n=1 Tax=Catalinimonas alkaloidigena TaxID=1075417 RepID=UPI0024074356|nr:ATP-binding protein [Catalinimonas alkaloidigena]MDF9796776.1 two-component system nitrogen regulation sensor histidine kinase NtrY [Catalinimonas alkaloidigena]